MRKSDRTTRLKKNVGDSDFYELISAVASSAKGVPIQFLFELE
jgi:hypothetical protein